MLKTRIIAVLLLKNGRMVKGKKFKDFRDVGDPISAARIYNAQNADELIFLDIDATEDKRSTLIDIIEKVSKECFMPFSVGGGVSSNDNIRDLLRAGADKVVINTASVENPEFINDASEVFGDQCVVLGIDVKKENNRYIIYTHSGKVRTELNLIEHIKNMEKRGAGEFFINSIDNDGMMHGYDLELAKLVRKNTKRPVIICGGAGNFMHLVDAIKVADVHAVACASIFHFGDNNPIRARSYLKNNGIEVKNTK